MHITITYDNENERKLANELQVALWYGHDFGAELATKLESDVDITIRRTAGPKEDEWYDEDFYDDNEAYQKEKGKSEADENKKEAARPDGEN